MDSYIGRYPKGHGCRIRKGRDEKMNEDGQGKRAQYYCYVTKGNTAKTDDRSTERRKFPRRCKTILLI